MRKISTEIEPSQKAGGKGHDRFGYADGEIDPQWANLNDIEVVAFHFWAASRMRIAAVDTQAKIVTVGGHTTGNSWWAHFKKGHRFLIINAKEALEQPGEWYLDRPTGRLTYVPRPGETWSLMLEVARRNIQDRGLSDRVKVLEGDLAAPLRDAGLAGALDMIVSNPPYVRAGEIDGLPPGVRDYEPRAALVAGEEGTEFHERIAAGSVELLKGGGGLFMEIAEGQWERVSGIVEKAGYRDVTLTRDYAGRYRVVSAHI